MTASNDGPKDRNEAITFTATRTGGDVDSYEWDFGDGIMSFGITTTHAYTRSGIFTATNNSPKTPDGQIDWSYLRRPWAFIRQKRNNRSNLGVRR